ncbi:hypothetical protein AB4Z39_20325 [Mycobacterium adipatum]|uniref:hypothetical protein n=1 Tax=Mycobacterium adipatum TaxID=1682113 RepID=UPI0034E0DA6E
MNRLLAAPTAALVVLSCAALSPMPAAGADPSAVPADTARYAIGMCYDTENPLPQRPAVFDYNCDGTGVLHDMAWTQWDAAGANGVGTDIAVQCQPNCAQGPRLANPVVVHAWNALPSSSSACAADARFYADMTIAYPHGAPPWIRPGTQWYTGADFVLVDGAPAVHFSGLTSNCEDQLR